MRRALASLAMLVASMCASLALTCFLLVHTVADPARAAHVADAVLSSDAGRHVLADTIAQAVHQAAPAVPDATATTIAQKTVTDPRLAAAVHAAATGDGTVHLGPILHDAAASVDPALAKQVPTTGMNVGLPGRGLTFLAPYRAKAVTVYHDLALLALGALAVALLVSPNRARVLRRAGLWCVGASAFTVFMFVLLPHILTTSKLGEWGQAAAVALRATGDGIAAPLTTCLIAGVGFIAAGIVAGFLHPVAARARH